MEYLNPRQDTLCHYSAVYCGYDSIDLDLHPAANRLVLALCWCLGSYGLPTRRNGPINLARFRNLAVGLRRAVG